MTDNIIKQPPLPDTIHFNHMMDNDKTEVMRITRNGVWVNPDMQVDETAKAVLDALDSQVKVLVQRAVEAEREKVAKWMMGQCYATGHGDTIEDLLKELEWQAAEREREAIIKWLVDEGFFVKDGPLTDAIRARGIDGAKVGEVGLWGEK